MLAGPAHRLTSGGCPSFSRSRIGPLRGLTIDTTYQRRHRRSHHDTTPSVRVGLRIYYRLFFFLFILSTCRSSLLSCRSLVVSFRFPRSTYHNHHLHTPHHLHHFAFPMARCSPHSVVPDLGGHFFCLNSQDLRSMFNDSI